jgi:dCMP deaminase
VNKDHISWDEYFMGIAVLSALRSKDPHTQVGSCIVNVDNRIIGIGYNGFPSGISDNDLPWGNNDKSINKTKYPYVVHAELNAILNATQPTRKARLYSCLFPCNECTKAIIQSGIKEVIYLSDKYDRTDSTKASKAMLKLAKVKIRKYKCINEEINLKMKCIQ